MTDNRRSIDAGEYQPPRDKDIGEVLLSSVGSSFEGDDDDDEEEEEAEKERTKEGTVQRSRVQERGDEIITLLIVVDRGKTTFAIRFGVIILSLIN